MEFGTRIEHDELVSVIALEGELDVTSAPSFRATVFGLIGAGHRRLVIDLSGLDFIDSRGLWVIVAAHREVDAAGGKLLLRHPRPTALKVLETTGLSGMIEIEP